LRIVCKGEGEVMSVENENSRDPRVRLIREKYFSIRPRPLERWLWSQGVPASAERVFWLHWQEGVQRGDWCSEIPLRRVARECNLDVSTVTRAYQLLAKMGCIRRTDPGRDPANPFQQATALTEVRLPRELLAELDRYPNRRSNSRKTEDIGTERALGEGAAQPAPGTARTLEAVQKTGDTASSDPLAGLRGRDRVRALSQLTDAMSAGEREAYQQAMRMHRATMTFDTESKLTEEGRAMVLQVLSSMAAVPASTDSQGSAATASGVERRGRKLAVFELARLRRDIQIATSSTEGPELLRQVVWSIEGGALRRFSAAHAINIALKKIREGTWTRPHRMPPNWVPASSTAAVSEACRAA
jgi:hypothetical protein